MKNRKKDARRVAYEAKQARKGKNVAATIFVVCLILSLLLIIFNTAML
ncbi:hypothetical protein [Xylanibacter muris]|uniref:Uncharacterized protein n=1 Tax=Xylanibacter muris TaxID=2736290 RepID=A0ABX2AN25_9BACT|nr:hypothetical protein [Xylanibacter muris]NPD92598.1 hypothetical protein [Xylanibacter muris]